MVPLRPLSLAGGRCQALRRAARGAAGASLAMASGWPGQLARHLARPLRRQRPAAQCGPPPPRLDFAARRHSANGATAEAAAPAAGLGAERSFPSAPPRSQEGFESRWLPSRTADGLPLYCGIWSSPCRSSRPRGIVIYVHGFGSHVHDPRGFEDNILRPLWQQGYGVWGFDSRGQGRTGQAAGQLGDIGHGDDRMTDLSTVIAAAAQHFPGAALFLMGHGLGGSEVLSFMSLHGQSPEGQAIRGLLLLAPCCKITSRHPLLLRLLMRMESMKGTTHLQISDLWTPSSLSKDITDKRFPATTLDQVFRTVDRDGSGMLNPEEFERALNGELAMGLTAEEAQATFRRFDTDSDGHISIDELILHITAHHPEDDYCMKTFKVDTDFDWFSRSMRAPAVETPLLLVHGRNDKVDPFEEAAAFVKATHSEDKTIVPFENLRHGVAMDMDAPRVLEELRKWLGARTAHLE